MENDHWDNIIITIIIFTILISSPTFWYRNWFFHRRKLNIPDAMQFVRLQEGSLKKKKNVISIFIHYRSQSEDNKYLKTMVIALYLDGLTIFPPQYFSFI